MNDMNTIAMNILESNSYCVVASVCEDGAPWATPVHFAYDSERIYWLSQDDTVHSQNIARSGKIFIIVFDSRQSPQTPEDRGAVYIATRATKLIDEAAVAARDIYADRYPDDNGRKLADWNVFAAQIGTLDEVKSADRLIYFRDQKGTTG